MNQKKQPVSRHNLTILAVSDLAKSTRFYRDSFNWAVRVDVPVYVEFSLPDGRGLGLYKREAYAKNTGISPAAVSPPGITGTEIYLHCDDVEETIDRLHSANARMLSPLSSRGWGDDAAYFSDPDGNVVVVARTTPKP